MLSTQGKLCTNKGAVLTQMGNLLAKLQGLQQQALQRIVTRKALADAANAAWLSAEALYQSEFKQESSDNILFQNQLKLVATDQSVLDAQNQRIATMSVNLTVQSADITNDEAIIRLILSDLTTLTNMPVFPSLAPFPRF